MIEPEKESGNIEYKRVLKNLSKNRYEELLSQLKWRVNEGNGIAYYLIGVEDDGKIFDLSNDEISDICSLLRKIWIYNPKARLNINQILNDDFLCISQFISLSSADFILTFCTVPPLIV